MKLKLILSYDGSRFNGSASQSHKNSVQDNLHDALKHLGIFKKPLFASRTDKGVHASRAVACIECGEHFKDLLFLKKQINKFAKPFIYIRYIERVKDDFEVRFDVKSREYRYIFNHSEFNPLQSSYCYFYPKIDIKKVNKILMLFEGVHDFSFFQKLGGSNKTSIREIFDAKAYAYKNYTIFHFKANGFLRSQIRLIVAAVLKVLEGKMSILELKEQIDAKKIHSRMLAPASGLYLSKISY
ncbi:tRNA pseudouridine(38-40) synthase TruA [Campylobacter sp. CCS1377]|uniref:tRNA pseudouridine synthase A n=1 Tax=Campylobacter sp. CCS1377 TaxID=3158229 RepID=A0AAU7E7T3_9BACT